MVFKMFLFLGLLEVKRCCDIVDLGRLKKLSDKIQCSDGDGIFNKSLLPLPNIRKVLKCRVTGNIATAFVVKILFDKAENGIQDPFINS